MMYMEEGDRKMATVGPEADSLLFSDDAGKQPH